MLEKVGGEGDLRQREQFDEGMKAGKHRTCMGSEEEFYLSGNDESQMEDGGWGGAVDVHVALLNSVYSCVVFLNKLYLSWFSCP